MQDVAYDFVGDPCPHRRQRIASLDVVGDLVFIDIQTLDRVVVAVASVYPHFQATVLEGAPQVGRQAQAEVVIPKAQDRFGTFLSPGV